MAEASKRVVCKEWSSEMATKICEDYGRYEAEKLINN